MSNKEEQKVNSPTRTEAPKFEAFVKSLPFTTTTEEIQKHFSDCGAVENVNLLKGRGGRSKGVAFVRFNNNESLQKAIQKNNSEFGGRTLVVEAAAPREQRPDGLRERKPRVEGNADSNSIFVGNLSYTTTEQSLRSVFEGCGEIKAIRIATDFEGRARGFAHVDFEDNDGAKNAVKKSGTELDGRTIRVDFSSGQRNGGQGGIRRGGRGGYRGGRGRGGPRPYGDRPYGDRREGGDRNYSDSRRDYGDRREAGERGGDRREGGDRTYGERRDYGDRREGGERREGGGGYRGGSTRGGTRGAPRTNDTRAKDTR
jgi:nucleolin